MLIPGRTFIIAEAGVNHDGSEQRARELIDIAADAGADAVKFQLFNPAALVTESAPTAAYQAQNLGDSAISQRQMLEKLTLPQDALIRLHAYCQERGITFLCTPFDHESLQFLVKHTAMPAIKLASGEVTNGPLLHACARSGLPVILSTGMATLDEISTALWVLHAGYFNPAENPGHPTIATPDMLLALREKVTLLHCISQYPAPIESANLLAMDTIAQTFALPTGFSDHTLGISLAIAASARGAAMLEKHFTYDTRAGGPDHAASLSPQGLAAMVFAIREVEQGMGTGEKGCQPVEENTRQVARRSVVAARSLRRGEVFSAENLICKRPAGGLAPNLMWELLGKAASRDYAADESIDIAELN